MLIDKALSSDVMHSPVIERLMVRGSHVALKHVIHEMETRTLVMELRRRTIKRWVPCGDMDHSLKIPHSKFGISYTIVVANNWKGRHHLIKI